MKDLIISCFKKHDIQLSIRQAEQFEIYMNFLLEENEKFNLTAITDPQEIILKHFIDSVLPAEKIKKNSKIIDVGTGAGFPGVPLKIIREDIELTLLDSLLKRVNFLESLVLKLGLKNVNCVHGRAEDFCLKAREKYDYAVSRAVAAIPTLSEYLLPYVKLGGFALMYKGSRAIEELEEGKNAIRVLGGKVDEILDFDIDNLGQRSIIFIKKQEHTDKKYPRGKNLPKTKPIL